MDKAIWETPLSLDEINHRAKGTLSDLFDIQFIEVGNSHLTARMPITSKLFQPMQIMHGGATALLAETVASAAANYCIDQTSKICVGMELNINHIRPMSSGFVDAIATPLHLGSATQVWEIKIYNNEKKLVSASRLTVAIKRKTPKETKNLDF